MYVFLWLPPNSTLHPVPATSATYLHSQLHHRHLTDPYVLDIHSTTSTHIVLPPLWRWDDVWSQVVTHDSDTSAACWVRTKVFYGPHTSNCLCAICDALQNSQQHQLSLRQLETVLHHTRSNLQLFITHVVDAFPTLGRRCVNLLPETLMDSISASTQVLDAIMYVVESAPECVEPESSQCFIGTTLHIRTSIHHILRCLYETLYTYAFYSVPSVDQLHRGAAVLVDAPHTGAIVRVHTALYSPHPNLHIDTLDDLWYSLLLRYLECFLLPFHTTFTPSPAAPNPPDVNVLPYQLHNLPQLKSRDCCELLHLLYYTPTCVRYPSPDRIWSALIAQLDSISRRRAWVRRNCESFTLSISSLNLPCPNSNRLLTHGAVKLTSIHLQSLLDSCTPLSPQHQRSTLYRHPTNIFHSMHVQRIMDRWWLHRQYLHPLHLYPLASDALVSACLRALHFCATWDHDLMHSPLTPTSSLGTKSHGPPPPPPARAAAVLAAAADTDADALQSYTVRTALEPVLWVLRQSSILNALTQLRKTCSHEIAFLSCCSPMYSKRHMLEPAHGMPSTLVHPSGEDLQRCLRTYRDTSVPFRHHGLYC
uniref:Motility protein A n=1 Tax=Lygus hesperus TaxID=30085 RepID=A0A0A9X0V7_LYGHE